MYAYMHRCHDDRLTSRIEKYELFTRFSMFSIFAFLIITQNQQPQNAITFPYDLSQN